MKKNIKKKILVSLVLVLTAMICGAAMGAMVYLFRDLPQIRALESFEPSAITRIYSADGVLLAELYRDKRDPVSLDRIPAYLREALIATEDRQFYRHIGVDVKGIARALLRDLVAGEFVEGASTITQQLAKTLFLTPEKTISRKLKEAVLALQLERRYTKDEILTLYLNQIYLGSGAYGVQSAARIFFAKPVNELNLAECALIAAMPKAPSVFSPLANPELAITRRNIVLRQMLSVGAISREQHDQAIQTPYVAVERKKASGAPYFIDHVKKILEAEIGPDRLYRAGLTVRTTLSHQLQEHAEAALEEGLSQLASRRKAHRISGPDPQGALVAIDIRTGGILAMIGGTDYQQTVFNRATGARRQPGSAFKPIVYATAIEQGFHQGMRLLDAPIAFPGPQKGDVWRPENFSNTYQGDMTLRRALVLSQNIPAVRLIEKLGPASVAAFARELGIQSALSPYLSLALGTSEVTVTELTAAYAVFANAGTGTRPWAVIEVMDAAGQTIWKPAAEKWIAMSRQGAAIMTNMLEGVIQEGTGNRAASLGHPLAGKTGTTNDCRDAWFVGFSPSIAAGVWVGCDNAASLGPLETGSRAALPIWIDFMDAALKTMPYAHFDIPDDIEIMTMDPKTGGAADHDAGGVRAFFRKKTAPRR
jgi:penicillin-binding protein 1A